MSLLDTVRRKIGGDTLTEVELAEIIRVSPVSANGTDLRL